jgi:hypothetical protein
MSMRRNPASRGGLGRGLLSYRIERFCGMEFFPTAAVNIMARRKLLSVGFLLTAATMDLVDELPVRAEPGPYVPGTMLILPKVFCFRVTDIAEGPGVDHFFVMFEVLNWTNQPATGLYIAKTYFAGPAFAGAGVKLDGRPLSTPGDRAQLAATGLVGASPGQPNTWSVASSSSTAVLWTCRVPALILRPEG